MSFEVMELFNIFSKTYTKEEAQTIVKDIENLINDRKKELAAKEDIQEVKGNLREAELRLTENLREVELRLTENIREVELRLTKEIKEVELRLTKEIEKVKSSAIKWVFSILMAQTGILAALILLK